MGKDGYVYLHNTNFADYVKGLEYLHKAVSINHGIELPDELRSGWAMHMVIQQDFLIKAKYYYQEAFKLDSDTM